MVLKFISFALLEVRAITIFYCLLWRYSPTLRDIALSYLLRRLYLIYAGQVGRLDYILLINYRWKHWLLLFCSRLPLEVPSLKIFKFFLHPLNISFPLFLMILLFEVLHHIPSAGTPASIIFVILICPDNNFLDLIE